MSEHCEHMSERTTKWPSTSYRFLALLPHCALSHLAFFFASGSEFFCPSVSQLNHGHIGRRAGLDSSTMQPRNDKPANKENRPTRHKNPFDLKNNRNRNSCDDIKKTLRIRHEFHQSLESNPFTVFCVMSVRRGFNLKIQANGNVYKETTSMLRFVYIPKNCLVI